MILNILISFILSAQAQTRNTNLKKTLAPPTVETNYSIENPESSNDLAKYFRENNCANIVKYFQDRDLTSLPPLELALVAYCEPSGKDPEKMFAAAEQKDPDDDVILLLHGRYRWKKYKLNANEVWKKLELQAKDPVLRDMALQYIDGNGADAEANLAITENRAGSLQVGFIRESNPEELPISDPSITKNWSDGISWNIMSSRRSDYEFGYADWSATFSGTQYNTASDANQLLVDFSPLFALQSSLERFLIIRPISNAFSLDGRLFYGSAGLSVGEMWQYPNLEIKILFSIFADHYYQSGFDGQAGTHYLLEEKGNLKLNASLFSLSLFWDKTSASDDTTTAGQDIPYTNNSGGISFGYQWTFQKLVLGFNSSLSVRQDENETYYFNSLGQSAIKKRRDMTYINEPWISWKFSNDLTGVLFYSSSRVTSNMTSLDIVDRNINDSVTGILLKNSF